MLASVGPWVRSKIYSRATRSVQLNTLVLRCGGRPLDDKRGCVFKYIYLYSHSITRVRLLQIVDGHLRLRFH